MWALHFTTLNIILLLNFSLAFICSECRIYSRFFSKCSLDLGKLSGGDSWSAPVLKAVGIKYGAVIVDFQLAPENSNPQRGLDIYVKEKSNERRFFNTRSTMWQDFNGESSRQYLITNFLFRITAWLYIPSQRIAVPQKLMLSLPIPLNNMMEMLVLRTNTLRVAMSNFGAM